MNGIYGIESISPLQGSNLWCYLRWTMSIAKILSAFSARFFTYIILLNAAILEAYNAMNSTCHFALKGLHIKEQDNVLCIITIPISAL